jgi:hypothetical protein
MMDSDNLHRGFFYGPTHKEILELRKDLQSKVGTQIRITGPAYDSDDATNWFDPFWHTDVSVTVMRVGAVIDLNGLVFSQKEEERMRKYMAIAGGESSSGCRWGFFIQYRHDEAYSSLRVHADRLPRCV